MAITIKSMGFIGLGNMGGSQASELVKLPMPLTVYDASPAAMQPFEGKATLATCIADLRDCDVVGICVQDDKQVAACFDELLPALQPGATILVHSTVLPKTIKLLAEEAAQRGIDVMDAPVTRTKAGDGDQFVFCMLGGDQAVMNRVQYVIDAFSTDTMLVGPVGSASALKICNNLISWGSIMLGLEALDLAEAADVPVDKLMDVLARNGNTTLPMRGFLAFRNDPGDAHRRGMMTVQSNIGEKDMILADELGESVGRRSRIGADLKLYIRDALLDVCQR